MFPNLLLNAHNVGPELRLAPLDVTSYIQIESVEMGEGWKRNDTAGVDKKQKALVYSNPDLYNFPAFRAFPYNFPILFRTSNHLLN